MYFGQRRLAHSNHWRWRLLSRPLRLQDVNTDVLIILYWFDLKSFWNNFCTILELFKVFAWRLPRLFRTLYSLLFCYQGELLTWDVVFCCSLFWSEFRRLFSWIMLWRFLEWLHTDGLLYFIDSRSLFNFSQISRMCLLNFVASFLNFFNLDFCYFWLIHSECTT